MRRLTTLFEQGGPVRDETVVLHSGYETDPATHAVAVPIYQTVAYEFDSAEHAKALFDTEIEGNIYGRQMNPTTAVLEDRVAKLEGGVAGLAVGSGAAAINYAIGTLARVGSNVVTTPQLYGTTQTLFRYLFKDQGIEVRFADSDEPDSLGRLVDGGTVALFCESVGNPAGNVVDIEGLAAIAHREGVPLIVDNTVATPMLIKPIDHGADIVLHSMTKYIGGHGNSLGGMIVDSGRFPWIRHRRRFPMMSSPEPSFHDVVYTDKFGVSAYAARIRTVELRNTGATLSPANAFLLLQGLETLPLRMERHCSNAGEVASLLEADERVAWVNYAGFPSNPYHELMRRYAGGRPSPILTFGVRGGYDAGVRFHDSLRLFKRLVNIGDTRSLVCHPASTTHRQLTPAELSRSGVRPEMIRLSIGIEHVDDLAEDLDQALEKASV